LQQQRRRAGLAAVAALEECLMRRGIADIDAHRLVPAIGDRCEPAIERRPEFRDRIGQRIREVFVLAAAKAVAAHHDLAAESRIIGIECGERAAFVWRQQSLQDSAALRVEIGGCLRPVNGLDAGGDLRGHGTNAFCGCFHGRQFRNADRPIPPDFR
jgi:hypothetical protein